MLESFRRPSAIFTALAGLFLMAISSLAADFYVSPAGDDANAGTKGEPFATLERARDAVREQKQKRPDQNFRVFLRGGVYRLRETLVFSLEDSAASGHTITYSAYRKEKPV